MRIIPKPLRMQMTPQVNVTAMYSELKQMLVERYHRSQDANGESHFILHLPFGQNNKTITGAVNFETFIQNYLKDDDTMEDLINEVLFQLNSGFQGDRWEALPVWILNWVQSKYDEYDRGEFSQDLHLVNLVYLNISQMVVFMLAVLDWLESTLRFHTRSRATHITCTAHAVYVEYDWLVFQST